MHPTTNPARLIDHTLLRQDARVEEIERVCAEAIEHHFYGVCVNSSNIPLAAKLLEGSQTIALSVVGFPLGAMSTEAKVFETKWAIEHGAKEIDTVVPMGHYLSGKGESYVRNDIRSVVRAAGKIPVKVILETALLTPEQIAQLTEWSAKEGAAFVKTSTGFSTRGASVEDVAIMTKTLKTLGKYPEVGVKASGGIKSAAQFKALVAAGATRLGCSASVAIVNELAGKKSAPADASMSKY